MTFLDYPLSLISALCFVYLLIVLYVAGGRRMWVRRLYGRNAATLTLSIVLILLIVFGLVPQNGSGDGFLGLLGLTSMRRSPIFILAMLLLASVLTLKAIDDISHIKSRKPANVVSHSVMAMILIAGIFLSGDKDRLMVRAYKGVPVSYGIDKDSQSKVHLPFALTLRDFVLEQYSPQLRIANTHDGVYLKEAVAAEDSCGKIGDWNIEVLEHLPSAGLSGNGFVPMKHFGSVSAARIRATDVADDITVEGWVSTRSELFEKTYLTLDDTFVLDMAEPAPKKYLSYLNIADVKGESYNREVSVNHPVRVGQWMIYQSGYDIAGGRNSRYSVFECVKDPLMDFYKVALWILMFGAAAMIVTTGRKGGK